MATTSARPQLNSYLPTYRVRITIRPDRTAVVGDITEYDISKS
jgi:hypothetical protein